MTDDSVVPASGSNPALAGDSVPVVESMSTGVQLPQIKGPLPYVDMILGVLTQLNVGAPIAFEAVRGIIAVFHSLHPDLPLPSSAEVIAALKERAQSDLAGNQQWLIDHGFGPEGETPSA